MATGILLPERDHPPHVTLILVSMMLLMATYVGFFPTEGSLSRVWWDEEAMSNGQWWRAVTALLAHGGILHLAVNLLALATFGPFVERRLGPAKFTALFAGAGAASVLAHAIYRPDSPLVGASGSIFGIFGLLLVLIPRTQIHVFFLLPVNILFAGALYTAFVPVLLQFGSAAAIAHEAHLGGMVFGAVFSFFVNRERAWRVLPAALAVFGGLTLIVTAWARLFTNAACLQDAAPLAWTRCVIGSATENTLFVLVTLFAVAGILNAYWYLERKGI